MTTLAFSIDIAATRADVHGMMINDATYRIWTLPFCEGSHFVGSWDVGAKIVFLDPNGSGMTGVIAEHRPAEFVSIKMLGFVYEGTEDTESAEVKEWAPAYENYTFTDIAGGTRVDVSVKVTDQYQEMMSEMWPKALQALKDICEL